MGVWEVGLGGVWEVGLGILQAFWLYPRVFEPLFPQSRLSASACAMSLAAPAQAEMAMVLGSTRAPLVSETLVQQDGEFVTHKMVDLCGREACPWLWATLGYSSKESYSTRPWDRLPMVLEIKKALGAARGKRTREGIVKSAADGKPLPTLVPLKIRGRELLVHRAKQSMRVNLGDSLELMNWFLAELWVDVRADLEPKVLEAEDDEPTDAPGGEAEQADLGAAGKSAPGPAPDDMDPIGVLLTQLAKHPRCKNASFDKTHSRVRVRMASAPGEPGMKPKYFALKDSKKLLETGDLSRLQDLVDERLADITRYLEAPADAPVDAPDTAAASADA